VLIVRKVEITWQSIVKKKVVKSAFYTWKTIMSSFLFAPIDGLAIAARSAQLAGFLYSLPHLGIHVPKQA
jgi:hypothetical protein